MAFDFAASILDALLGFALGPADPDARNRVALEGVSIGASRDRGFEIRIDRFEVASLRLASGSLGLEVGRFELHQLVAQARIDEAGRPRIDALQASDAELAEVKIHGTLAPPTLARPSTTPTGSANTSIAANRHSFQRIVTA